MDRRSRTVVGSAPRVVEESPRALLDQLVMTWAHDIATGQPVYIMELDAAHNGNKCGCECGSCGQPLKAANAGKEEGTYVQKPHFKHQAGVAKESCLVLAARAAALRLLIEGGVLDLPARTQSSSWIGLSGEEYQGTAKIPRQRQALVGTTFHDRTSAVVELEDGRRVLVTLTGTNIANDGVGMEGSQTQATIFIDINDPALASLDPAELRARLKLLPEALCWQSHWDDTDLEEQASLAAREQAQEMLDWPDSAAFNLSGIPPELRRETLLHLTVKQILSMAAHIRVPELVVEETVGMGPTGGTARTVLEKEQAMTLSNVRLEQRFGNVIPDVCADCVDEDGQDLGILCIEVTVTNGFDDERLERVMKAGRLALEIDLRDAFGRISRSDLAKAVIDGLSGKRWLHHPRLASCQQEVRHAAQVASEEKLEAVRLAQERSNPFGSPFGSSSLAVPKAMSTPLEPADLPLPQVDLQRCRQFVEKQGPAVWPRDLGLVDGLVSLRQGIGLGVHDGLTGVQVAHKLRCTIDSRFHALVLIALHQFGMPGEEADRAVLADWVERARKKVKGREAMWLPPLDMLIVLKQMFPELSKAVERMIGVLKRPVLGVNWSLGELPHDRARRVVAVRQLYHDGAYRLYAPKIDYDRVLAEAKEARAKQESLSEKLAQWSAEFALEGDYKPLLTILREAGLVM
jgi:hypothetical protein